MVLRKIYLVLLMAIRITRSVSVKLNSDQYIKKSRKKKNDNFKTSNLYVTDERGFYNLQL